MKTTVSIFLLVTGLFFLTNDLRSEISPGKTYLSGRLDQSGFYDIKPDSIPPYDPGPFGQFSWAQSIKNRPSRWYTSFSVGKAGSLNGSYEIEKYYKPEWFYSFDFGFIINPYVVVLVGSYAWGNLSFSSGKYISNYWNNFDYILEENLAWYLRRGYHGDIEHDYQNKKFQLSAKSDLNYFSYVPGLMINSPDFKGLKGFARIGFGVYLSNVSMETQILYNNPDRRPAPPERNRNKNSLFTMLYSAGLEHVLFKKYSLMLEMRYSVIYSGKENSNLRVEDKVIFLNSNPLLFYYMSSEGLKIHRFMEEKNLTTFDLRYGMTFRF